MYFKQLGICRCLWSHKKFAQQSFAQNAVIIPIKPCGRQEITVYLLI